MIDFAGQVVVVTGAGRGLGRLYALELARRGASVVVNDLGGSMHGEGADVSVADGVVREIERAGRLDAVVSNAGIFHTAAFDQLSHADWRRMLNVHLDGGFHVSQPAFRVMKAQGYGRFVFIASSAGLFGQPLAAHYAAAKTGLLGLCNVIALEGAPHGILANTVLPFGHSRMVTDTVNDPKAIEASAFLSAIRPELVVPIVVFLTSRACGFSHHNYSACAGRYARVFVGLGDGWVAGPGSAASADEIAAHLTDVSSTKSFTVPMSIFDEVVAGCARLGITG